MRRTQLHTKHHFNLIDCIWEKRREKNNSINYIGKNIQINSTQSMLFKQLEKNRFFFLFCLFCFFFRHMKQWKQMSDAPFRHKQCIDNICVIQKMHSGHFGVWFIEIVHWDVYALSIGCDDSTTTSVAFCSDSFVSFSVWFSFVSPLSLFVAVSTTSALALSDSLTFLSLSWNSIWKKIVREIKFGQSIQLGFFFCWWIWSVNMLLILIHYWATHKYARTKCASRALKLFFVRFLCIISLNRRMKRFKTKQNWKE